ncbi:unnamed protein product [Coregonus sp. 'balchen']|nr:unnamed protein product [Coregonus sp. 'balchen']
MTSLSLKSFHPGGDCAGGGKGERLVQHTKLNPGCQTVAAVEKGSTWTITKELLVQLDCAHDHQYTTESCRYTPKMELTESESESEISEDQN